MSAKDNDLHPARFTNGQIKTIKHIMGFSWDYFEKEAEEFFDIIKEYEEVKTDAS